ncbi:hypothetical protein EV130_103203 [Rhizobium azibense]|uniref:Uncharacterized protein n=1 Tax=Rhizobium azibense TaxID=1136135 RepID=A0A4R3QYZ6_9HYPH|nr:hypothetical protein EV130_103203 [Rhizobium azibense]
MDRRPEHTDEDEHAGDTRNGGGQEQTGHERQSLHRGQFMNVITLQLCYNEYGKLTALASRPKNTHREKGLALSCCKSHT